MEVKIRAFCKTDGAVKCQYCWDNAFQQAQRNLFSC